MARSCRSESLHLGSCLKKCRSTRTGQEEQQSELEIVQEQKNGIKYW